MAQERSDLWWSSLGACKGAPSAIFISEGDEDDEPPYPAKEALRFCDACPVKPDCLAYAMTHKDGDGNYPVGVWGGMSSYQRDQLRRKLNRSKCVGCGSDQFIVGQGQQELCLACGVSWYVY
jgi:hypothetical protein